MASDSPRVQIVSMHYAPEQTGNAPYVTGLACGLASRGIPVSVLAAVPHYPGWTVFPENEWVNGEDRFGVQVQHLSSYIPKKNPSLLKRFLYEVVYGWRFSRLLDCSSDVVVLVSPALFSSAVARVRLMFSKHRPVVILWMQDIYSAGVAETPGKLSKFLSGMIRFIEGSLARSASLCVVIHDRFRSYVTAQLGVDPAQVEVIRNWCHVQKPDRGTSEVIRQQLGWDDPDEIIVLHAGNMGEKQGLDSVVDAARWAESHQHKVKFVLMGGGNQLETLKSLGDGCTNLQFLEPVDATEFSDVLGAADVLLVNERPSLNDAALPSKLTSYFATGQPVLAATSRTSITSEEMTSCGVGRVVQPADPQALVDAAEDIAHDWTPSNSRAAMAYVHTELSEAVAIDRFFGLIETASRARSERNISQKGNAVVA